MSTYPKLKKSIVENALLIYNTEHLISNLVEQSFEEGKPRNINLSKLIKLKTQNFFRKQSLKKKFKAFKRNYPQDVFKITDDIQDPKVLSYTVTVLQNVISPTDIENLAEGLPKTDDKFNYYGYLSLSDFPEDIKPFVRETAREGYCNLAIENPDKAYLSDLMEIAKCYSDPAKRNAKLKGYSHKSSSIYSLALTAVRNASYYQAKSTPERIIEDFPSLIKPLLHSLDENNHVYMPPKYAEVMVPAAFRCAEVFFKKGIESYPEHELLEDKFNAVYPLINTIQEYGSEYIKRKVESHRENQCPEMEPLKTEQATALKQIVDDSLARFAPLLYAEYKNDNNPERHHHWLAAIARGIGSETQGTQRFKEVSKRVGQRFHILHQIALPNTNKRALSRALGEVWDPTDPEVQQHIKLLDKESLNILKDYNAIKEGPESIEN